MQLKIALKLLRVRVFLNLIAHWFPKVPRAIALTKSLITHPDAMAAFQEYQFQRYPRTKMIVEESLQAAQMMKWENPVAVAFREKIMKLLPTPVLKNKIKPLHSYKV